MNRTRYIFVTLVLVGFIGASVLGVLFAEHSMSGDGGCASSTLTGTLCPTELAEQLQHHTALFGVFTNTLVPQDTTLMFAFMLLFLGGATLFVWKPIVAPPRPPTFSFLQPQNIPQSSFTEVLRWLALSEHSPSR